MCKRYFTVEDVKKFLKQVLDCDWNYIIIDETTNVEKKAQTKELIGKILNLKVTQDNETIVIKVYIHGDSFYLLEEAKCQDVSVEWGDFLNSKKSNVDIDSDEIGL